MKLYKNSQKKLELNVKKTVVLSNIYTAYNKKKYTYYRL